jgi:hypothetical protein
MGQMPLRCPFTNLHLLPDLFVGKAFDGKEPEDFRRPVRYIVQQSYEVIKLHGITLCGRRLALICRLQLNKPDIALFLLIKISHGVIYQPPDPSFKGSLTSEGTDFLKDLEEPIIQYLQGFVFIPRIFHTHAHHGMEVLLIQLLLTLAVISYASLYEFSF